MFWTRISEMLLKAFQYAIETGCLHETSRLGINSLIPKTGRDLDYVKNWRPIVLLNTDYKIFSKVIASRIKGVLDKLIHPDQKGFMKQRQISDNLRKLMDAIEYAKMTNSPGIIASIDFEKSI